MKADRDNEKANLKRFDDKIADLTEQRNKTEFLFAQKDQLLKKRLSSLNILMILMKFSSNLWKAPYWSNLNPSLQMKPHHY
jgi:hypothetical protein